MTVLASVPSSALRAFPTALPGGRGLADPRLLALPPRETLRARCLSATSKHRAEAPQESPIIDAWTALVSGRYAIVDHFDADGRRLLLAEKCVGDPNTWGTTTKLSVRETQVAAFVAVGHPLKVAAYELGLSVATVGRACTNAVRKLGLRSRTELAAYLGALLFDPRCPTGSPT